MGAWQGGSGREPSGSTLLKRGQLAQLGYTAVAVPYWEWNALEGKVCYLVLDLYRHLRTVQWRCRVLSVP